MSQPGTTKPRSVTPPPSLREPPLTPPSTAKKPVSNTRRVITLFRNIRAGRNSEGNNTLRFKLTTGEIDQIQSALQNDVALLEYVKGSIRCDYDETTLLLQIRMPTGVHEFLIDLVEDDIRNQLRAIHERSSSAAHFAESIRPARSTEIRFANSKSRFHPDISFGHKDARFPGLVVEVAFSQEYKHLRRLAENYILDSDANIRIVVGINIAYGNMSRRATISIWRPRLSKTLRGYDLEVEEEVMDEAFRNDEGGPVEHPGLRFHLSDFTCRRIVEEEMGGEDAELCISGSQLCQYVATAENNVQRAMREEPLPDGIKINKRRRSSTPPEEIRSEDEAKYIQREEKVAKREDHDSDYEHE
ncbi:hypothetical protein ACN47E_004499 [Coniothyrium glycines]